MLKALIVVVAGLAAMLGNPLIRLLRRLYVPRFLATVLVLVLLPPRAGDVLPADRGSGARVLIAFNDHLTMGLPEKDREMAAEVRAKGYCTAVGDRLAEVAGISAPVFAADGQIAAAVTLTMPAHRYDERFVKPVLEAARQLTGRVS